MVCGVLALAAGCGEAPEPRVEPRGPGVSLVADGPSRQVLLWAVGDGDAGGDSRRVVERIAADRPERVLYLGDVYDDGTAEDFVANFETTYGRLRAVS